MMKTDILFSSPSIRFSRLQKESILAWGKDLGARDVPSLYKLEKFQDEALEAVGDPIVKIQAASGNIFYMNSVRHALARDYAHPEKRSRMHVYPEFTGQQTSEVWQAHKWLVDAPDDILTPMARIRGKDYCVHELVQCDGNVWFIPTRFFECQGEMWAKGHSVSESEVRNHSVRTLEKPCLMTCSRFRKSWPEIMASDHGCPRFSASSASFAEHMPHPDRALADSLEVECPPLIVFIDDVSGNSSKQWNVHYSCYISNGSLPRTDLEKEINVNFVATSPHASPMEIIKAVCDELKCKGACKPFTVYDAVKRCCVLIRPWVLFLAGDNPMQAELCSHIGLKGNHFCRICKVGGDREFKCSDVGYASLLKPGEQRKVSETREAVMKQLVIATHAAAEKPLKQEITSSGVKDSFALPTLNLLIARGKQLRKATPHRKALSPEEVNKVLYDELMKKQKSSTLINPLLDLEGLDVHRDTPVEPLHTHLLGVVKYFWAQTVWALDKQGKFTTFQARLNSLSRSGLKIPNIMADYMCRYRGSLIGKHFKTISQVMSFAIAGLVDDTLQQAWGVIGRLTVLIWEVEIEDIKRYAATLRTATEEVLNFAAALSPGLLTEKNKFHILLHLADHVEWFGPALIFSTERYEAFNHIFRLCSIHSNWQAPSRDIAITFAHQARCRHMVTGGYWLDKSTAEWVRAGDGVLQHMRNHSLDARLLGISHEQPLKVGTMHLTAPPPTHPATSSAVRAVKSWNDTKVAKLAPHLTPKPGRWSQATTLITSSGDTATIGAEVLVHANGVSCTPHTATSSVCD
ncbi:hypothetical protein C8Q74DRAFT_1211986 [Fomes fomentarius]|nr:hypothetical protein C8Q74DRAFT_1211986 [Fomes fomentarius]